jgi:DNA-binding transcriptional MerR regulator
MASIRTTLRSGELAELCGISTDTLRFYERRGLLPRPPRNTSGYRRYPTNAVDRVRMIQHAISAGFTIADLARILKQRDEGGAPCREVWSIASTRLDELNERIAELIALRDRLQETVADWRRQLDGTPAGARARLLEGLSERLPGRRGARLVRARRVPR